MSTASDVERAKKLLGERAEKAYRALALETSKRLIEKTPVRDGRARANWMWAEGSPNRTTTEDTDKSGAVTITKHIAQAPSVTLDKPVYITNSLPYIGRLEAGSSTQAPSGMVALTAEELKPLAGEIARKARGI